MPISWWKSFGDDDLIHITLHMIIIPFACLYRQHSWEGLMGLPGFEPYGPAGTRARCVPILLGKGFSWILEDFHWSGEIPRNLLLGRHSQDPRKEGDRTIQVEPAMAMRKWGGELSGTYLIVGKFTNDCHWPIRPPVGLLLHHQGHLGIAANLLAGNACHLSHSSLPLGPWLPFATRWPSSKRLLNQ